MPKLHAVAHDMEFTLVGGPAGWTLKLKGASDESIRLSQEAQGPAALDLTKTVEVNNDQAAAIVALFIASDMSNEELTKQLYELAEPALVDVERELRPIP